MFVPTFWMQLLYSYCQGGGLCVNRFRQSCSGRHETALLPAAMMECHQCGLPNGRLGANVALARCAMLCEAYRRSLRKASQKARQVLLARRQQSPPLPGLMLLRRLVSLWTIDIYGPHRFLRFVPQK